MDSISWLPADRIVVNLIAKWEKEGISIRCLPL
jgi:hypothetical protein